MFEPHHLHRLVQSIKSISYSMQLAANHYQVLQEPPGRFDVPLPQQPVPLQLIQKQERQEH